MSSYFDDASLVMIPSGYKTSKVYSVKPTDGTGDLTFTRSNDTATRVGPNGLIEKVRTNVILQSNTFSTTWATSSATITGGQSGYDGSSDAWLLTATATTSTARLQQGVSLTGVHTTSIYAKAGTTDWIAVQMWSNHFAYFDVANGVVGGSGNVIDTSIEAVGNGYYRCSITYNASSVTNIWVYVIDGNGSTNVTSGKTAYVQSAQIEAGDIATDYIATTTAAVSVGPVANVPRLDYLGSSCPRLILEPQRSNLLTFSESFDNAAWPKLAASVLANDTTSPDGYTNADKLRPNSGQIFNISGIGIYTIGSGSYVRSSALTLTAASYTFSAFVKKGEYDHIQFRSGTNIDTTSAATATLVNLNNGTIVSSSGTSSSIEDYGNGWYRVSHTFTATAATWYLNFWFWNTTSVTANGTDGVYIYGAQCELGAYATSYIPTLGASVTRGGENASKTGLQAAGVFGATAGSVVLDFQGYSEDSNQIVWQIANASATPIFRIYYKQEGLCSVFQIYNTINGEFVTANFTLTDNPKIAIVWDGTSRLEVFGNGAKITRTGGLLSSNAVADQITKISTSTDVMNIKQMLIFPTALTDAQAIELTTL